MGGWEGGSIGEARETEREVEKARKTRKEAGRKEWRKAECEGEGTEEKGRTERTATVNDQLNNLCIW